MVVIWVCIHNKPLETFWDQASINLFVAWIFV